MATNAWVVLQHVDWEGPGLIGDALRARGHDYRLIRPDREPLPPPETVAGLVVMGGPMGVYEKDQHPWLAAEQQLIATLVGAACPVLGVCLGSQLLAAALGATVAPGPVFEVGPGEVRLSAAGMEDPVLGPAGFHLPVVHWHQDTFPLPDGAIRLASSDLYPQQAFRYGKLAYGLQFHCEVNADLAAAWRPRLPAGVTLEPEQVARVAEVGQGVIARFLRLALA